MDAKNPNGGRHGMLAYLAIQLGTLRAIAHEDDAGAQAEIRRLPEILDAEAAKGAANRLGGV